MEAVVLVVGFAVVVGALCSVFTGSKSGDEPVVEESEFAVAKRVLARPRQDAETGEWYAYKLTRVPAEPPRSHGEPQIIDPMQRKARS